MAVGTSYNALMALDFRLDGFDRLELMDVRGLAFHVVDVQRGGVGVVAAIGAPCARLKIGKPLLHELAVLVRRQIHAFPIPRLLKSAFAPFTSLFSGWLRALGPRATGTQRGAIFSAVPLGGERLFADNACPLNGGRIFPGRHNTMISSMDVLRPCKPDIFEQTYEVAE